MNGREQPYINGNGTGYYHKTPWEVTPQDEYHFNNLETGTDGANLLAEFLTEVVFKNQKRLDNVDGEVITRTLTNTKDFYFNNSVQTVAIASQRDTLDYRVDVEVQGDVVNVGDVVVFDKQQNGFKVKYTGSAPSVTVKLYVRGGNAA